MQEKQILKAWPGNIDLTRDKMALSGDEKIYSIISYIEQMYGWVYDAVTRRFVPAVATHGMDNPDEFGRATGGERVELAARQQVAFGIKLIGGGTTIDEKQLAASGQKIEFWGSAPAGLRRSWGQTVERQYTDGAINPQAGGIVQVNTKTKQAGFQADLLIGMLPGQKFRSDSTLSVSSFTGSGVETTTVNCPLQIDGPRRQWLCVYRFTTMDADLRVTFQKLGLKLGAGLNTVSVYLRVE